MDRKYNAENFNEILNKLKKEYRIFAPVTLVGKGTLSDTNSVKYKQINKIQDVEFRIKSSFSAKEVYMPITETLFYFTEDAYIEPKKEEKKTLVFLRSCDVHALKRSDEIYLRNGFEDPYYKHFRDNLKIILIGCENSFDNCFCVSMETNKTEDFSMYLKYKKDTVYVKIKDDELLPCFQEGESTDIEIDFVEENNVNVSIPENLCQKVFKAAMWDEYDARCIACGRCNFVCPTCTCFTMQDIHYKDNPKNGERRRVWASCQVDGYTDMAGGHSFRRKNGERMRFKTMHKIYDFKKRFGYHMCVGCGRCDDVCPQYISFSNCVNKLNIAVNEVE